MSLPLNTPTHTPQAFEVERYHMVEQQIRPWNVSDPDILALLGRMHREDFVPAAYRNLAFSDLEIPLREGAAGEGPAMLAPKVEARILHDLHVQPHESVLEIGTGSGYQTAVLSQLVERVFSVERIKVLQDRAKERLVELNLRNVVFRWGDGWEGWPALAPYNGIIVTAVATDVPQALLDQLAPGGRLVIPVGSGEVQQLMLIIREDEGFSRHVLGAVRFVPLLNGPLA